MADKASTLVLEVDLECERCYKKIRRVLCKIQDRMNIKTTSFDAKRNLVTISGPFDAEKVRKKLCCEAGRVVKSIKIKVPEKTKTTNEKDQGGKTATPATPADLELLVKKIQPANKPGPNKAPCCKLTVQPSSTPAQGVARAAAAAAASIWPAPAESVSGYRYQLAPSYYGVPVYNVYNQGWYYGGDGGRPLYYHQQQPPPPFCEEDPNAGCSAM